MLNLLNCLLKEKKTTSPLGAAAETQRVVNELINPTFRERKRAKGYEAYALRAHQLDQILDKLTKTYCKDYCTNKPVGCCNSNYYFLGFLEGVGLLQEREAKNKGWEPEISQRCKYHSLSQGCNLIFFKPPACLGYLCSSLRGDLEREYGLRGRTFITETSALLPACVEGMTELLKQMDRAIITGKELIT